MALKLVITNVPKLDNGVSTTLALDRSGALIGRSATADWSLPDPHSYISSTHCEIEYRDQGYVLVDRSLNGTLINGGPDRMAGPHRIAHGDVISVGHYEISCQFDGAERPAGAEAPAAVAGAATPAGAWSGWDRPQPVADAGWAARPAGGGSAAAPGASVWSAPPPDPGPRASPWSSPVASPAPGASGATGNIWEQLAASNVVDWARGGFGADRRTVPTLEVNPGAAPGAGAARDPFGLDAGPATPAPLPSPPVTPVFPAQKLAPSPGWGSPAAADPAALPQVAPPAPITPPPATPAQAFPPAPPPAAAPPPRAAPPPPPMAASSDLWNAFAAACGLQPGDVTTPPEAAMQQAGDMLRQMIAGLVVLLEARARAKAQLGAQGTALEFDGNNPLKFARSPERAIAQMLNPPERGFMPAGRAVEDAFKDLQAHQMATLAAMQGALAATLDRFSPEAIRARAESHGILAKVLPTAREAELWKAYEREFEGVSRGSDEAFMDVFAKEFRAAYERAAAELKTRR
ncbi:type VI secretion system-associated FHA domain protein TagH [Caulobacter sp. KR2-114]|uniref:type VI secretion system-associated FHA domain protein TagH n=1 Tax=Caulobacter sp. KR2-114 TaxID=3400912 RepID=UPI003BFCB0C8